MNCANAAAATAAAINASVAEETRNRIDNVLSPTDLSAQTRLLLLSAVHVDAELHKRFDAKDTVKGPFHVSQGKDVQVRDVPVDVG